MSGMVHQDLTQFFISCLLLISCTSVDKKHRLSDRMRLTLKVLAEDDRAQRENGASCEHRPFHSKIFNSFMIWTEKYWKSFKICLQKELITTRPTHQSPTRSSNCSREMPEAVSHPNWEHISWLFRKRQNAFFKWCLKVLNSKLVILGVSRVKSNRNVVYWE